MKRENKVFKFFPVTEDFASAAENQGLLIDATEDHLFVQSDYHHRAMDDDDKWFENMFRFIGAKEGGEGSDDDEEGSEVEDEKDSEVEDEEDSDLEDEEDSDLENEEGSEDVQLEPNPPAKLRSNEYSHFSDGTITFHYHMHPLYSLFSCI
jgi:hypothetical protein